MISQFGRSTLVDEIMKQELALQSYLKQKFEQYFAPINPALTRFIMTLNRSLYRNNKSKSRRHIACIFNQYWSNYLFIHIIG